MLSLFLLPCFSLSALADSNAIMPYDKYGSARVFTDQVILNSYSSQSGALWAKEPNNYDAWTLEVKYRVNGGLGGGKGMAIWYTADKGLGGPVYGSKDAWDGLGIFLSPTASGDGMLHAHLNDRTTQYTKLDEAGTSPAKTRTRLKHRVSPFYLETRLGMEADRRTVEQQSFAGCKLNYRNLGTINSIVVQHDKESLKVSHDGVLCFENKDVSLPKGMNFGVSALAGEIPDSHEIFGFQVQPSSIDNSERPKMTFHDRAEQIQKEFLKELQSSPQGEGSAPSPGHLNAKELEKTLDKMAEAMLAMSRKLESVSQLKSSVDMLESLSKQIENSIESMRNKIPESDPNFSPKVVYQDLARQVRNMEDNFKMMEQHITTQTEKIVDQMPAPASESVSRAVKILVFAQLAILGIYILYKRRTEEKSKFL